MTRPRRVLEKEPEPREVDVFAGPFAARAHLPYRKTEATGAIVIREPRGGRPHSVGNVPREEDPVAGRVGGFPTHDEAPLRVEPGR